MKSLNNVGAERLGDALGESIDDGAKLSIISSYFTVFAYGELKEELSKVDEVRFLFSEPTFVKRMADSKEPREFEVARRAREVGVGGSGLELTLRNNLNQRALARECAEWIREKGVFKSAKTSGAIQPGGTYVVEMVFGYPGLGTLAFESALYKDFNVLMAGTLLTGALVIFCNMLGEVLSAAIDPRMRDDGADFREVDYE